MKTYAILSISQYDPLDSCISAIIRSDKQEELVLQEWLESQNIAQESLEDSDDVQFVIQDITNL